jgi:hypothetical protein
MVCFLHFLAGRPNEARRDGGWDGMKELAVQEDLERQVL